MEMKPHGISQVLLLCLLAGLISGACGPAPPAVSPTAALPGQPPGEGRCGDGVCDGPENAQLCPEDCAAPAAQPAASSQACSEPNPRRASLEELVQWRNWLEDGGFEEGRTEIQVSDHHQSGLNRGRAERSAEAALSGSYGYALIAGPNQGLTFSVVSYLDKGETARFSFWARSPAGEVVLRPMVTEVERGEEDRPAPPDAPGGTFQIGSEWTQVSFEIEVTKILRYTLLSIEVGPNSTLYIDDVQVEQEIWKMAEYDGDSRTVGGIPVPMQPVAPTYINFLIHIEDPSNIQFDKAYFEGRSAVFIELAKILHQHGGMLTIQPEEDWVMAAEEFAPGLLQELAEMYGVQYSTHTHGPHCRDDEGRLRSYTDCTQQKDNPEWDQSVNDYDYPEVLEYAGNLQELIAEAANMPVTDHNGNWEFPQAGELSELGFKTWSAYKNWTTQRTYPYLINNPWRPGQVSADADLEEWLTHDPNTEIVYIPGWGQLLTRWSERAQEKLAPILSQWIANADAERVNTFYVMLHAGVFEARDQEDDMTYTVYNAATDTVTLSDELKAELAYWDMLLTELIDPLVAEGYLQWASLPEMGQRYLQWEHANCGATVAPAAVAPPQAASGAPEYEPPINIFLVLHIDPDMDRLTNTFKVTPAIYQTTHDEIDWLMDEAERHGLHFTSLYNGWYTKWALEHNDLTQFEELLAAGHEIGTHAHRLTYDAAQDLWVWQGDKLDKYGRPNYDFQLAEQSWSDADSYLDALLAQIGSAGENQSMCAVPFLCSDEGLLMDEFGFSIAAGGRCEKATSYFGHIVWNPWRPGANDAFGHELEEDLDADYITLDHLAQIGKAEAHGMDLSVAQMQRRFLMLYVEWLSRERSGAEDRVWSFGFVYHPNYGDAFNAELTEFLTWLDENFVSLASPYGNVIARYATASDIAQEYYAWEDEYPGVSSFSYVLDDPYPYTYEIVPRMLEDAAYDATLELGEGISAYRFLKGEEAIYMLWSDSGERTIDLSAEVGGQLRVTDAAGTQTTQDASQLTLTAEPLFVEPLQ
jgi:hypothetical protein